MNKNDLVNPIEIFEQGKAREEALQKTLNEIDKKASVSNGDEKNYLLIYYATDGDEEIKSFEIIKGREAIYDFIKGMIESLDIHNSKVLADNVGIKDAISVYSFMKLMGERYFNDGFDIEDYNQGDYSEEI